MLVGMRREAWIGISDSNPGRRPLPGGHGTPARLQARLTLRDSPYGASGDSRRVCVVRGGYAYHEVLPSELGVDATSCDSADDRQSSPVDNGKVRQPAVRGG